VVVLDTHAWLWWTDARERLSDTAREVIGEAPARGVPAICCWELAMLVVKGRIALGRDTRTWIRQALGQPGIVALPLSPKVAVDAALLDRDEFEGDPADRLIYATARDQGSPLVTRDARLRAFDPRGTVW
jgi:PIN domain nuclease of toxin-antitoxin system